MGSLSAEHFRKPLHTFGEGHLTGVQTRTLISSASKPRGTTALRAFLSSRRLKADGSPRRIIDETIERSLLRKVYPAEKGHMLPGRLRPAARPAHQDIASAVALP